VWGLSFGLLLGTVLGILLARRQHGRREQRGQGGSVTDWGQSLSLVYELRREITRLRQTDRTESRAALARVADSLEREARRRLPVHSIEPVSGETSGMHGPSSRSPGP
jgi:hypothetical protein